MIRFWQLASASTTAWAIPTAASGSTGTSARCRPPSSPPTSRSPGRSCNVSSAWDPSTPSTASPRASAPARPRTDYDPHTETSAVARERSQRPGQGPALTTSTSARRKARSRSMAATASRSRSTRRTRCTSRASKSTSRMDARHQTIPARTV